MAQRRRQTLARRKQKKHPIRKIPQPTLHCDDRMSGDRRIPLKTVHRNRNVDPYQGPPPRFPKQNRTLAHSTTNPKTQNLTRTTNPTPHLGRKNTETTPRTVQNKRQKNRISSPTESSRKTPIRQPKITTRASTANSNSGVAPHIPTRKN